MVLTESSVCNFGEKMTEFRLLNIDGKKYSSNQLTGKKGTVIMFICNHCPYVKAIIDELVVTVNELKKLEINSVAIMSNDFVKYPEDNYENMKKISKEKNFSFHYLLDSDQSVAKKFGAVCTPEFFGYDSNMNLQYRGRFAELKNLKFVNKKNDLYESMKLISENGKGPKLQFPSAGCSIKWK